MSERIPLVLKFEDWPQADRSAWEQLFTHAGFLEDTGAFAHWSEGSRAKRRQGYGQWLSFLARTDPAALDLAPALRVTRARVRAYVEECQARLKPCSTQNLISDLFVLSRALAPVADWGWLNTFSNRLLSEANRTSLPAGKPITAPEILQWSLTRMEEVEADISASPRSRAIHFRQALMIGFLIARPLRRRTLLGMELGQHLIPSGTGFQLQFRAEDMKDKRARSFAFPANLVAPMQTYLETHRPLLLNGKTDQALWINQYGRAITPDGFSRALPEITKQHLGIALRPHVFRHIAATSIAELDPEHVNIIRDLLGHATLTMSERHYNRATGISSCNRLQSIVKDMRRSMPIMGRAKRQLHDKTEERPEPCAR